MVFCTNTVRLWCALSWFIRKSSNFYLHTLTIMALHKKSTATESHTTRPSGHDLFLRIRRLAVVQVNSDEFALELHSIHINAHLRTEVCRLSLLSRTNAFIIREKSILRVALDLYLDIFPTTLIFFSRFHLLIAVN